MYFVIAVLPDEEALRDIYKISSHIVYNLSYFYGNVDWADHSMLKILNCDRTQNSANVTVFVPQSSRIKTCSGSFQTGFSPQSIPLRVEHFIPFNSNVLNFLVIVQ